MSINRSKRADTIVLFGRVMRKDIVKRSKLLIVDDQEANVGLLLSILREQGFLGLQSLTDARLVLPLFLDFQPDLVLLDLRMPHIDGLSLLKQLRSRIADNVYLPFVIVTADLSQRTRQAALSLGAKDFLTKPINPAEAVLRIYNLLETRYLYLELQESNRILDERVRERTQELELAQAEMLRHLALAGDYRDDLTGLHAQRVGVLAALLAEATGVPGPGETDSRSCPPSRLGQNRHSGSHFAKDWKSHSRRIPGRQDPHRDWRNNTLRQQFSAAQDGRTDCPVSPRTLGWRRLPCSKGGSHSCGRPANLDSRHI